MTQNPCRKRTIALPSLAAFTALAMAATGESQALTSPNGDVKVDVTLASGRLTYQMQYKAQTLIANSNLGITIGNQDLGAGATLGTAAEETKNETYPVLGKKSLGTNHYNANRIPVTSNGKTYTLEMRAYNDGIAFRYVVPGTGTVNGEATSFTLPASSTLYYQTNLNHYEGNYETQPVASASSVTLGLPLTIKLTGGQGYAAITEGALVGYSGMALQGAGNRVFRASFKSAIGSVSDTVKSPWRIVMVAPDLNGLVNSDIVQNVNPAPDPVLFPQGALTSWLKPGRVSWSWMASDYNAGVNVTNMRAYSDNGSKLGWEYNIVDDGWASWSNAWTSIKDLATYAKGKNVGTIAWVRYTDVDTDAEISSYFQQAANAGLAGLKIDFMDSEARNIIDWYPKVLRAAAQNKMVLDFHGAGKPTGLERTWPNEMTREAIKGREYGSATPNNVYYPFTRYLAGHGDYTPMWFESLQNTSHAHQIAGAVIFTSPLLVLCENPSVVLTHPAVEIIKAIPSTWDETRVLPPSEVNDVAVFARRKGDDWFLAVLNSGNGQKNLTIPLSFLKGSSYTTRGVRDMTNSATSVTMDAVKNYTPSESITVTVRSLGGFVAHFVDANPVPIFSREDRVKRRASLWKPLHPALGTVFQVDGRRGIRPIPRLNTLP